jgi:hypothetical protein
MVPAALLACVDVLCYMHALFGLPGTQVGTLE